MAEQLHVVELAERDHANAPAHLEDDSPRAGPAEPAHHLVERHFELGLRDGLDDEPRGPDLVTAHCVLGKARREDEGRVRVVGAHELGRFHAVDARELDIKENEVKRAIAARERRRHRARLYLELKPALLAIAHDGVT